jgi:hypothetical protein
VPNNVLLISDIHSRDDALRKLLESEQVKRALNDGTHLVFLGDLSDCRDKLYRPQCSFLKVYELVRQLCEEGYATLLHSNHAQNLCDRYFDRRKVKTGIVGFKHTLSEIETLDEPTRDEMISWLDSRPLTYTYTSGNGKTYNVAHAFYQKDVEHKYSEPNTLSPEEIDLTLRGRKSSWLWQGRQITKRTGFWRNPKRWGAVGTDVLCSGHWAQIIDQPNCVVNDPGGDATDGTLGVFDCNNHQLIVYENQ